MLHMAGARFPTWANNGNINMGTFGSALDVPNWVVLSNLSMVWWLDATPKNLQTHGQRERRNMEKLLGLVSGRFTAILWWVIKKIWTGLDCSIFDSMENCKEMVLRNTSRKRTSIYGNPSVFLENDLYMLGVPRKKRDFTGCQCHPLNAANLATVAIASAIGDV